ncbi:MAG: hypothetical protein A2Y17_06205 [Clostridiales bacterium GWF2_38_85]|nr:MAG: hypothetical protein A2Y17_06205 [Clostridiales bacterium GWF2_38_85]HBL85484.1 hypothetical protein [Clostridiales bacterium]
MAKSKFKNRSPLAYGAVILTAFTLICRFLGMAFRMYLTTRIGSEGIGLYQLIMSVYTLFATLSTAGFTIAVSRLAAERLAVTDEAKGNASARKIFKVSSVISLTIATVMMIIMVVSAQSVAELLLKDTRVTVPLRVLALTMPFIALSSCLKGYFLAKRNMWMNASAMLFEQIVKIAVIMCFIGIYMSNTNDIGRLCMAVVGGATLGEVASYIYLLIMYYIVKCKDKTAKEIKIVIDNPIKTVLSVTLPIAASAYVTNFLHTGENIIIPMGFVSYGSEYSKALADFGIIRGMAIPALFFPFAFLSSLVAVLIPEISRENSVDKYAANNRITKVMNLSFIFSIISGAIFFFFSSKISYLFYHTEEAAFAIKMLATVTPLMYMETICDGLLKGIGQQMATLRYNIYNSILRIIAIMILIPKFGVIGYLIILIISNTFSFFLMYCKLKKITEFKQRYLTSIIIPLIISVITGIFIIILH